MDNKLLPMQCTECGMVCDLREFHPMGACLMFKACRNGDVVRANLAAIRELASAPQASAAVAEALSEIELPDVEDLAHEIAQECLAFGLSAESIARYLRSYEKKVHAALAALAQPRQEAPAAVEVSAETAGEWKSRLMLEACSKWSGNQKIEAGDIIEWIAHFRVLASTVSEPLAASPAPASVAVAEGMVLVPRKVLQPFLNAGSKFSSRGEPGGHLATDGCRQGALQAQHFWRLAEALAAAPGAAAPTGKAEGEALR